MHRRDNADVADLRAAERAADVVEHGEPGVADADVVRVRPIRPVRVLARCIAGNERVRGAGLAAGATVLLAGRADVDRTVYGVRDRGAGRAVRPGAEHCLTRAPGLGARDGQVGRRWRACGDAERRHALVGDVHLLWCASAATIVEITRATAARELDRVAPRGCTLLVAERVAVADAGCERRHRAGKDRVRRQAVRTRLQHCTPMYTRQRSGDVEMNWTSTWPAVMHCGASPPISAFAGRRQPREFLKGAGVVRIARGHPRGALIVAAEGLEGDARPVRPPRVRAREGGEQKKRHPRVHF
jgi:hypothetical protein